METIVGTSVGIDVEMSAGAAETAGLALRLLGPLSVERAGVALALPSSRKVRALLAYLAFARHPVMRDHLCELLWDLPSDPRGELRWCLSKLRGVMDEPGHSRVVTSGDSVTLDLAGDDVDARHIADALQAGVASLPAESLQALAAQLRQGEFLEGLDLPRSPAFTGWVAAQRRRFRAAEAAVLEHWVRSLPAGSADVFAPLERWLAIAPFDRSAHELMLDALASSGRLREGEDHLATTARHFDSEGQDWAPIGHAWRAAKQRHARSGGGSHAVVEVVTSAPAPLLALEPLIANMPTARASVAVMPFIDHTPGTALRGGLADGLAHDIITRLAKLRSVFVIAQGTVFALNERQIGPEDAGRRLNVDYVASGSLRRESNARLSVNVQLTETRSARVLWAEVFNDAVADTFDLLEAIGNRIVNAIASEVELAERNRAILKAPNSLNAWEAHHRGLWHMVRFTQEDNEQARHFFQSAVRMDPTFARSYAGLSFTHFQDAFLGWRERDAAVEQAYGIASQGLMADDRDPTAHWALGRALWLKGRECLTELETAVELSPNFALGHYTLAFVHSQTGDPQTAIARADHSRALSPFDPLQFGMLASRALGLMRLGRYDEAADWAVKAAARPNAHVHILGIAMYLLALSGRVQEAQAMQATVHRLQPGYGIDDFLKGFRLGEQAETLTRQAAVRLS